MRPGCSVPGSPFRSEVRNRKSISQKDVLKKINKPTSAETQVLKEKAKRIRADIILKT